ncbi:MAG: hypothetical protein COA67_05670 [Lutibacter sp.]|nr:MAG: hypothetical protein COA67_05670 [Lutibacter sp.]
MKKTLTILIILLGFSCNSFAQEKQNDATWNETIEFLKNQLNERVEYESGREYANSFKITSTTLTTYFKAVIPTKHSVTSTETIKLNNLLVVNVNDEKFIKEVIVIRTVNKSVLSNTGRLSYIAVLRINDEFERNRILKAFKHLTYLAQEKNGKSKF